MIHITTCLTEVLYASFGPLLPRSFLNLCTTHAVLHVRLDTRPRILTACGQLLTSEILNRLFIIAVKIPGLTYKNVMCISTKKYSLFNSQNQFVVNLFYTSFFLVQHSSKNPTACKNATIMSQASWQT